MLFNDSSTPLFNDSTTPPLNDLTTPPLNDSTTLPLNDSTTPPTTIPDCPCRRNFTDLRGGDCLKVKNLDCIGTLGYFTRAGGDFGILSSSFNNVTLEQPNRLTSAYLLDFPDDHVAYVIRVAFDNKVDASHSSLCDVPPLPVPDPPYMLVDGTIVLGTQRARCWNRVRFCGCGSGCTPDGRIHSTNWCGFIDVTKPDGFHELRKFCNQILFTQPPVDGDSGSLLINADTNRATGLVLARIGNRYGLANQIGAVLNRLGVRIAV